MISDYPFHYEVRAKLLAFDKNNNVRNQKIIKTFNEGLPLEQRRNAFEEFNEYLTYIEQNGRLKKNKRNNFYITQPSFVDDKLGTSEYSEYTEAFNQFKEEIAIVLVVDDKTICTKVLDSVFLDEIVTEFEIHKVTSFSYDEQDIVDNLGLYELPLYEHFNIKLENLKETVYHYGSDYADSGEDKDDGAKRIILRTPHNWDTLELYLEYQEELEKRLAQESIEHNVGYSDINFLGIIQRGESNQVEFKPSLLYNFKTEREGFVAKYHIAKTICAFLNSNGGVLFVGVKDDGSIQGLECDYSLFKDGQEKDKILLKLDSLLHNFFGLTVKPFVDTSFEEIDDKEILVINVHESHTPIFMKSKNGKEIIKEFFIRMNASTRPVIDVEEIIQYVFNKNWKPLNY